MPRRLLTTRRRLAAAALCAAMCVAVPVAIAQDPVAILGTDAPETLNGTPGEDALYGRGGNDTLNGLAGDDELDGGSGGDTFNGGDGKDAVSYAGNAAVSVTIDGAADDGVPGEGDNVGVDVEDVFGTDAGDTLSGSSANNTLDGGAGNDVIDGGDGIDTIYGDEGNDIIKARDGKVDRIECGPGQDTASIDRDDTTLDCEDVEVAVTTPAFKIRGHPARTRLASIELVGVVSGSRIVVACRSGCRPARSRTRPLVTKRSARLNSDELVPIRLPARPAIVGGTTFEIGVTAPRAPKGRCKVFRVARRLNGLPELRGRACRSAARTR